jgi:hypothetical protein
VVLKPWVKRLVESISIESVFTQTQVSITANGTDKKSLEENAIEKAKIFFGPEAKLMVDYDYSAVLISHGHSAVLIETNPVWSANVRVRELRLWVCSEGSPVISWNSSSSLSEMPMK